MEVSTAPYRVFSRIDDSLFEAIRSGGFRKVAVQVPAGLIRNANELTAQIRERTGVPAIVVARACFGACDLPSADEAPGADLVVAFGHAPIPNMSVPLPTFFVESRYELVDVAPLVALIEQYRLPLRLGLVASIQHLDMLEPLSAALRERGFSPVIGSGERRLAYPGQALGCNYTGAESTANEVDAFLFLGTGQFHPIGLALATEKPAFSLDPLQKTLDGPIDRGALIRRRQLLVASCRDARRFGILVSTFPGQNRHPTALALQRRAHERGRDAEILVFGRLDPRDLEGRAVDAYVNTACPRIATDDSALYPRPMLTPQEFLMAIGEVPLEPYRFDTFH